MNEDIQIYFQQSSELNSFSNFGYDFPKKIEEQVKTGQSLDGLHCLIKRRSFEKININKKLKRNANMPKSIILNFYKYLKEAQKIYEQFDALQQYQSTRDDIKRWLALRVDLNTAHLEKLFGEAIEKNQNLRNYLNCRAMQYMINNFSLKMVSEGTKIEDTLTYLFCIQKYASRLGKQKLTGRVQSK